MKDVILLDKLPGETPLECLERFRSANPEYQNVKMTYAGRLDPMASGLLVVLAGDMVHKKDSYLGLSKTYQATVVLGISTDTYDGLGMPTAVSIRNDQSSVGLPLKGEVARGSASDEGVRTALMSFLGTFTQKYPPYSSKTINGIQMHELARNGKLESADIPHKQVTVTDILNISSATILLADIAHDIIVRIGKVNGDFRQAETVRAWKDLAESHPDAQLETISFTIGVSGGTYIRGIADKLGKKLQAGAFLWKLHRAQVGEWNIDNI